MADKEVRKLAAVMFTDIEGYTSFVQKDEKAALRKVSIHRQYLEQFTAEYNGQVIAFYGDGSLSIYDSAIDAVHCAIAMQRAYQSDHPIPVRIGIHVGDIVLKEGSVFGDGVNVASRLQTAGIPGSIYISDRVQSELRNHPEIKTRSIGKKKLKNVTSPIEIFVVANEGLRVPSAMTKMPDLKKSLRLLPILLIGAMAWWFLIRPNQNKIFGQDFTNESISVPVFINHTGDAGMDHVAQMAAHWITKELGSIPNANVVSYESASNMMEMAGVSLATAKGRSKYLSLTGAVNIVDAAFFPIGANKDSLLMSGFIKNLETGKQLQTLKDVKCNASNPMDCILAMSGNIKGYWASRGDHVMTPPNYEAYKAYLAAKAAWRTQENEFVFEQLNKAISLDPGFIDPYFLMLDFFYNEGMHQAASDTIKAIRKKFTDLTPRQNNMLLYHTADVEGKNAEAYQLFLNEYMVDPNDLFINNSAMVMALMYRQQPREALAFFDAIPFDSLPVQGCHYCSDRLELAMWAALDADSMKLADQLAPKIANALYRRQSYGMLIMYYVRIGDTTKINQLITAAQEHVNLDRGWQYLPFLAGRLFLLQGDTVLSSRYARKAIESYLPIKEKMPRLLGKSYYLDHQYDKALRIYKEESKKSPDDIVVMAELGMIYARLGNKEEALKIINKLASINAPFSFGATEYFRGRIYGLLGEKEKAVDLIRISISKGQKYDLWLTFRHDPDLMVLKDFGAFKDLVF